MPLFGGRTWFGLWVDVTKLNIEAMQVVGLRLNKIAKGGPTGLREVQMLVPEKLQAGAVVAMALFRGGDASKVVRGVRKTVRSNYRRLSAAKTKKL